MSSPEFLSSGKGPGRGHRAPRKELQGPRPTTLKVNKDSFQISKPPIGGPPQHNPPASRAPKEAVEDRQPIIIYAVSPKVIHTTAGDFMSLVQRLTGPTSQSGALSTDPSGSLSPAARIASIEKTTPRNQREVAPVENPFDSTTNSVVDFIESSGVLLSGGIQGILSPAPASLPQIPSGLFSPVTDPYMNMFITSPATLFSAPLVSPSPTSSPFGLFNQFFDFS